MTFNKEARDRFLRFAEDRAGAPRTTLRIRSDLPGQFALRLVAIFDVAQAACQPSCTIASERRCSWAEFFFILSDPRGLFDAS